MFKLAMRGLLAVAMALGVTAAAAATMTATYTGTIGTGSSASDYFGVGSVLNGAAYSLVFQYDTTISADSSPVFEQVYGGDFLNPGVPGHFDSPILSAILTIGSIFYSFDTAEYGQATVLDDGTQSYAFHFAGSILANMAHVGIAENRAAGVVLADLDAAQEIVGGHIPSKFFNQDQGDFRLDDGTTGTFTVDYLSISVTTVPLPASLPLFAMALLGFGMLRRRVS